MTPLANWPVQDRRHLIGVFTDIDDTLTTQGVITPDALQALMALQTAGLAVVAITGRPVGWCAAFANGDSTRGTTPWPLTAIVAENGAAAYVPENLSQIGLQRTLIKRKQLLKIYQKSATERQLDALQMQRVTARVLREVPQARLSQDSCGRETDLAFDYNEHQHLPPDVVQQVLAILQEEGMHTSVSSIHVHGCFGDFNKWSGAIWLVQKLFKRDLAQELDRWVFVGDSGNDQPMFQHFSHSVGVANIRHCAANLTHLPRYVTQGERGAGFAEVASAILGAMQ